VILLSHRIEKIHQILEDLRRYNPDVEACALISSDGLPIASIMPPDADEAKIAAMAAAIQGVAEKVSMELKRGAFKQVLIQGELGGVLVTNATSETAIVVVLRPKAKLGLILLDIREAIKRLAEVF